MILCVHNFTVAMHPVNCRVDFSGQKRGTWGKLVGNKAWNAYDVTYVETLNLMYYSLRCLKLSIKREDVTQEY